MKKSCGHQRGYVCACHPLSEKRRKVPDLIDLIGQPIGKRLESQEPEDAGIDDEDEQLV